jgi:predicted RNA binding protein YcfA (HicA-like mRNA interferase family)
MTSKEALRRLQAEGWKVVRSGKHTLLEKDGNRVSLSLGAHLSLRHERGVMRLLEGRPTARDEKRQPGEEEIEIDGRERAVEASARYRQQSSLYEGSSYDEAKKIALDAIMEMGGSVSAKGDMVSKYGRVRVRRRSDDLFEVIKYKVLG